MKLNDIEKRELNRYFENYSYLREFSDSTILITGSKGIVGNGIIKWLLYLNENNNAKIRIIASTRTPKDIPEYIDSHDSIEFCEFGKEYIFCEGKTIDYIIHAASPTSNMYHKEHPYESIKVILEETIKMLELAKVNKSKMIFISSEEVYGLVNSEDEISEEYVGTIDSLNYRSCYPLGKKAAELMCLNAYLEYGVETKIIRLTGIQGLFQHYDEERVVNEILRCILENRNLALKSAGTTKKCMLYSLDAISAIFTVLTKGKNGEAYNATNQSTFKSINELASDVFEIFNKECTVLHNTVDDSISGGYLPYKSIIQSNDKIYKLGWKPITSLEQIYAIDIERFGNKN